MEEAKKKKKLNISNKIASFFVRIFQKYFSFENGIDISNETQVLYRRNRVIKNIVLITNLLYSIILLVITFGDQSNIFLTVLCFPLTFFVNRTLSKMIFNNEEDYVNVCKT